MRASDYLQFAAIISVVLLSTVAMAQTSFSSDISESLVGDSFDTYAGLSLRQAPPILGHSNGKYANDSAAYLDSAQGLNPDDVFQDDAAPDEASLNIKPHWSGLPIWGFEARKRGYDIPLPFGVGFNFYSENQPLRVTGLHLNTGSGRIDLDPLVNPSVVDSRQSNLNGRFDVWIFPFLNVYGILGYTDGESALDLTIPPVGMLPGQTIPVTFEYEGPTYGGGITLAGGVAPFEGDDLTIFTVADFNYTLTDLEFTNSSLESNSTIKAGILSLRLGVRDRLLDETLFGPVNGALWFGSMYQDIAQTIAAGVPGTNFIIEVDQTPQSPWNALVGGRLEIGSHIDALIEVGFIQRTSVMLGVSVRF